MSYYTVNTQMIVHTSPFHAYYAIFRMYDPYDQPLTIQHQVNHDRLGFSDPMSSRYCITQ
jgi:hypothetical protein